MNSSDYILKNGAKRLRIRKYLGFCIKMVRKGNKYLDLVLKWCEKCQRRRELLTVGGSIVGTDEVQSRSCLGSFEV